MVLTPLIHVYIPRWARRHLWITNHTGIFNFAINARQVGVKHETKINLPVVARYISAAKDDDNHKFHVIFAEPVKIASPLAALSPLSASPSRHGSLLKSVQHNC